MFAQPDHQTPPSLQACFLQNLPPWRVIPMQDTRSMLSRGQPFCQGIALWQVPRCGVWPWPFPELPVCKALVLHPASILWSTKHTLRGLGYHTTQVPLLCPHHWYIILHAVKVSVQTYYMHASNFNSLFIISAPYFPFSWCWVTWISFTQITLFQKTSTKSTIHLFSCNFSSKENYWKLISVSKSQFF